MAANRTKTRSAVKKRTLKVAFVSTMDGFAWGGSEELWSRAALDFLAQGMEVSAGVCEWKPLHARMRQLSEKGVELWLRPQSYPILKLGWQRIAHRGVSSTTLEVQSMLGARKPTLVIFSSGGPYPPIDLVELCMEKGIRFVTIGQANWDWNWIDDKHAARYRRGLSAAIRCFFVSSSLMKNLKSSAFVLRFSSSYKRSVRFGSEWSRLVATLPCSEPTRS